jgi:hypothetical protein
VTCADGKSHGIFHVPLRLSVYMCVCRRGGNLQTIYKTGKTIPKTGIYRVSHAGHRLPHECTLIEGYLFPRCSKCDDAVQFEIVAAAPLWQPGPTRTIILHELPEIRSDQISTDDVA